MNEAAEKIVGLIEKRMYGFAKIEESSNLYKDLGFDSLVYVSLICLLYTSDAADD